MKGYFLRLVSKATSSDESSIKYGKVAFLVSAALSIASSMVVLQGGVLGYEATIVSATSEVTTMQDFKPIYNELTIVVFGVLSLIFAAIAISFAMIVSETVSGIARQRMNSAFHNRKDPIIEDVA
jgi:hypothetical protein